MLVALLVRNYALIREIQIEFSPKLSIITGETGAGKSIILGAINLMLGGRADKKSIQDQSKKCVIEAHFTQVTDETLHILKDADLDYDDNEIIIRRELSPSGKSRAFINDTPTNLTTLRQLAATLLDLNRQHDLLDVQDVDFHYDLIDAIAGNTVLVEAYRGNYRELKQLQHSLKRMQEELAQSAQEQNYLRFQIEEVEALNFDADEYAQIEDQIALLSNQQTIIQLVNQTDDMLVSSDANVVDKLRDVANQWSDLSEVGQSYDNLSQRLHEVLEELNDIAATANDLNVDISDEYSLDELQQRRDAINAILFKHRVETVDQLQELVVSWQEKLGLTNNLESDIALTEQQISAKENILKTTAAQISKARKSVFRRVEQSVNGRLQDLGMKYANIKVKHSLLEEPKQYGVDDLEIVFASNKGSNYRAIKDVASGGEMSRLMLCMKTLAAGSMNLPSLIFDEIDTGVSGEVAGKMGRLLSDLAQKHQVIVITHSPQVASKADLHFEVYKDDTGEKAESNIRVLTTEERIKAVAKMLSGDTPSDIAIQAATELVNSD